MVLITKLSMETQAYFRKPSGQWRAWWTWTIELIGTFLMVFMILSPAAFGFSEGAQGKIIQNLFSTFFFKAFYAAFFIYVLVVMFRKVSSNFNPVVSIVHMVRKDDSVLVGSGKIVMQFAGAFAAAYLAQHLSEMANIWSPANSLDSVVPTLKYYDWLGTSNDIIISSSFDIEAHKNWYWIVVVMLEAIYTFALLGSVFMGGKYVSYKGRPLVIFLVLLIILTLGIRTSNISLNPARLIAPAVVGEQFGGALGSLNSLWMFLVGQAIAVILFSIMQLNPTYKKKTVGAPQTQGFFRKYIGWEKAKTKMNKSGNVVIDWDAYLKKELTYLANQFDLKGVEHMTREVLIDKIKKEKTKMNRLTKKK